MDAKQKLLNWITNQSPSTVVLTLIVSVTLYISSYIMLTQIPIAVEGIACLPVKIGRLASAIEISNVVLRENQSAIHSIDKKLYAIETKLEIIKMNQK